jgi:hypothetical protein
MKLRSTWSICRALILGAVLAAGAAAIPASAHHSFAMFDQDNTVQVQGTLVSLELTNPHAWLTVMGPNKSGRVVRWSIEMGGVGQVRGMGLKPESVKPGDKMTVTIHPLRNGATGGSFISLKLPDGHEFIQRGLANPAPPAAQP